MALRILTEQDKKEICEKYVKNSMSMSSIAKQYGIECGRLRNVLVSNDIEIRDPRKKTKSTDTYIEDNIARFPKVEGKHYIAVSKIDGSEYNDYLNVSGSLTRHIKDKLNITAPSLRKRKRYFLENKKQWFDEWFEYKLVDDIKNIKCPYCSWQSKDDKHHGGFTLHLQTDHCLTVEEYLKLHPEDRDLFSYANKTIDRQFETNKNKYVECAICGKKLARIGKKHLDTHNITRHDYILKYGFNVLSNEYRETLVKNITEVNKNMHHIKISNAEREISDYICSFGINVENNNRTILEGKEIDIYIPELKVGIEYNGNFWHGDDLISKNKHVLKTNECKKQGVKLIQIFEDEFTLNKDIVFNKISHILKIDQNLPKVFGRKCSIQCIDKNSAKVFLTKYHIQGYAPASVYLGAFYNNDLIGVMSFKEEKTGSNKWELNRFASNYNYVCCGVGGKLFKYFITNYNPEEIKSFADRRWTVNEENNIYIQLGFKFVGYTKPDYRYYYGKLDRVKRWHKFNFRKKILNKKYGFDMSMTENEMVEKLGCKKVWDAGLIKYIWKK